MKLLLLLLLTTTATTSNAFFFHHLHNPQTPGSAHRTTRPSLASCQGTFLKNVPVYEYYAISITTLQSHPFPIHYSHQQQ
jgi:hypothetical protein